MDGKSSTILAIGTWSLNREVTLCYGRAHGGRDVGCWSEVRGGTSWRFQMYNVMCNWGGGAKDLVALYRLVNCLLEGSLIGVKLIM